MLFRSVWVIRIAKFIIQGSNEGHLHSHGQTKTAMEISDKTGTASREVRREGGREEERGGGKERRERGEEEKEKKKKRKRKRGEEEGKMKKR